MSASYDCTNVVDIADEPQHHLIVANPYVRAFAVEVAPHTRTLCHRHPHEYLLYVADGAEIISAAREEEPKRLSYRRDEYELSKAGLVHVVENLGDAAFRNLVVELRPPADKLKRGAKPHGIGGEAKIETLLEEVKGAVFRAMLEPGAELEIAGPAVVAAPQEAVMMKELDEFDIPLDDFRKLMWVCAPRKVEVKNAGQGNAAVIVFTIGKASK